MTYIELQKLVDMAVNRIIEQMNGESDYNIELLIDVLYEFGWTKNLDFCLDLIKLAREMHPDAYKSACEHVADTQRHDGSFDQIAEQTAHYVLFNLVDFETTYLIGRAKRDIAELGFYDESTGGGCVAHSLDFKNGGRLLLTDTFCGYVFNPNAPCSLHLDDADGYETTYFSCDNLSEALTIAKVIKRTQGV